MTKPPALDPSTVEPRSGSAYPQAFKHAVNGRTKRALTDLLGLTQFGVNVTELAPGAVSALRHWHTKEDEFVYVLSGELTLVTGDGEQRLSAGMCAGFPAGVEDGHCLKNPGDQPAVFLEVGSRDPEDEAHYPDDDLFCLPGRYTKPAFTKKDGTPLD